MAAFDAVLAAPVDDHHLILRRKRDRVAIDRNDLAGLGAARRGWHVVRELARRLGQHAVAHAHFFLGRDDVDRRRNDLALGGLGRCGGASGGLVPLDVGRGALELRSVDVLGRGRDGLDLGRRHRSRLAGLAAHDEGLADVLGLIGQNFARARVLEWYGVAEDPVVPRLARRGAQGLDLCLGVVAVERARIGTVSTAEQHAAVFRGHDPGRLGEGGLVHDQGLGEEGLDGLQRNRGNGGLGQAFVTRARRHAHGLRLTVVAGAARAQAGAATRLVEVQHLARVDQVRVADVLQVHAPELGPAPGALEEDAGNAPQGVAAFDGVAVGRVGGQFVQRHAGLGHQVGGGALVLRDRIVLGPGRCAGQRGEHGDGAGQWAQGLNRVEIGGRAGFQWHVWALWQSPPRPEPCPQRGWRHQRGRAFDLTIRI